MKVVLIIAGIIAGILFIIFVLPTLLKILLGAALIGGVVYILYKIGSNINHKNEINAEVQEKVNTWLQGKFCFESIDFSDPYSDEDEDDDDDFDDDDDDYDGDDDYDDFNDDDDFDDYDE